jgi:hypothetical protein
LQTNKGRKEGKKDQSQQRGKSHMNKASDLILEHVLDGGEGAPSDQTSHKGKEIHQNVWYSLFAV